MKNHGKNKLFVEEIYLILFLKSFSKRTSFDISITVHFGSVFQLQIGRTF